MARWEQLASAGVIPLARSSHTITAVGRKLFGFGAFPLIHEAHSAYKINVTTMQADKAC